MNPSVRRGLAGPIKLPLMVASVVIALLGLDLLIFPGSTARSFSWTILPPITAGALAGFYLAAFVILVLSLRTGTWAAVRVVIPGGVIFSALAIVATILHFDKFHQSSPDISARIVTWVWIVAYSILPPALLIGLIPQRKIEGSDVGGPKASGLARATLTSLGVVLMAAGVALFAVPLPVARLWPWVLTALTGRVLGAWSIGLGLVFAYAVVGGYWERMRASLIGLGVFAVLQILNVVRFHLSYDLGPRGAVFIGLLVASSLAAVLALARGPRLHA